ncbi:hypothetical protein Tco_1146887, partial [Tanacetum coccineum]
MNKRKKHFEMLKAEERRRRPPTKAQKRKQMCTYLKNMAGFTHNQLKSKSFEEVQQAFNRIIDYINNFVAMDFGAIKNKEEGSSKRTTEQLESNISKKQKLDENEQAEGADDDSAELKRCMEIVPEDEDDVTIDATSLSSKSPTIIDYKIHKEGKKNYFKIIKADGNSQLYLTFGQMFKNFNREELEVLWSITMFEHEIEDTIWTYQQGLAKVKNWKLYDSCGVYCITMQNIVYYLLVEKMYPLTENTLDQLWNDVRLQVDIEVEMAYDLLGLIRKQIREGYVANAAGIQGLFTKLAGAIEPSIIFLFLSSSLMPTPQ